MFLVVTDFCLARKGMTFAMVWMAPDTTVSAGLSAVAEGIVSDTSIATPDGWRPAASLAPGADVVTFDHGIRPIKRCNVQPLFADAPAHWPLRVPVWSLDNRDEVVLLPEQKVLIEADVAEELFGEAFVLVPAMALDGWRGIERFRPAEGKVVVQLCFEEPEIIYASRGILLSCAGDQLDRTDWLDPGYQVCTLSQARHLMACIMAEEAGAALREARRHLDVSP